ncbi:MAG: flagellar filament capping protein FliD [Polymorphum sp.]|uniref:Flagellar hook-associated protein 2 n=1 Tax=Pannonibacter phragmitetus TaxID=121719 RepID=A0A0U3PC97_9HYPH|nr:flagellar filament capping protein FliD [Pannonibacter phragmitetus]ALV26547.1 flagellar hook protein [Pannonibacter phragmitetus]MBA4204845.1 flagellar filament capping protein FliD [Polymorphum sp.]
MATVSSTTSTTTTASSYTYSSSTDIDWSALVEVAVAAKTAPADAIDVKIAANEVKIAAYEEMQSLLQAITSAADAMRGTTNSIVTKDDVFSLREAYLTSSSSSVTASSAVVVTAENGAQTGTYDLQILQLATTQKVASSDFSSRSSDLELSGTFSIGLEGMESVEITVTEDMSLSEIASAINAESATTGVQASVVKVTESTYRLVLSGTETGKEISLESISGDDIGQALGLTDSDGAFASEIQAAKQAIISLDGIEITRSTNTIDDVLDGISFTIYQTTGSDATISVEIANDLTSIKDAIVALVDAYNAYREWALTQQAVSSSGGAAADATLFGDSTLRSANNAVASALSTMIDSSSMALLGLSYDTSNYLVLNETTLNSVLLNDLDALENILMFQFESSSEDLVLLSRNSSMPSELTLDIQVDSDGNITSVSVNGDTSLFTVSDTRIKGAEGTIYEGMTLVFTGSSSQTVTIQTSSGIVEKLYNSVDLYSNSSSGLVSGLIDNLTEKNEDYSTRAADIRSRAETYRTNLTNRYASYQAAIEAANSTLLYLEALLNSGDD